MTFDVADATATHAEWTRFISQRDERGKPPLVREQMAWLADRRALSCDMVEVAGKPLRIETDKLSTVDLSALVHTAAEAAGLINVSVVRETDSIGKGRGKNILKITGTPDPKSRYTVESIDVTRTRSRPYPPFITSTLQQAASSRLGMSTDRTMRIAQQLYEGIDLPGEGLIGLITYMRTDSTNISREGQVCPRKTSHLRKLKRQCPRSSRGNPSDGCLS